MTSVSPTPDAAAWRNVSINYPHQHQPVIEGVSLALKRGERLLLLGPSGCGKSTLIAALTGLIPHAIPAHVEGQIQLERQDVGSRPPAGWASMVAFLFQDADQTLCGMTVGDEIAFALENRSRPEAEIKAAVQGALDAVGLPASWLHRRTMTLSGGEKQLVAIAAAIAQDAPILIADEPTANLSAEAAKRLHNLVGDHLGTVLLVDHRLDGLIGYVDRVVLIDAQGRVAAEGPPRRFFRANEAMLSAMGVWRPAASRLDAELQGAGLPLPEPPLDVEEVVRQLPDGDPTVAAAVEAFVGEAMAPAARDDGPVLVRLRNAACAPLFGPVVLEDISCTVRAGETTAILGRNGAGKSTLAASLAGLLRLKAGNREGEPAAMAFQNPEAHFTCGSVFDELSSALPADQTPAERSETVEALLRGWRLEGLARRHPFELSFGQKRRLALAALTVDRRWPCLVLDEPTAGLDYAGVSIIANQVRHLAAEGRGIVIVTHDIDFALSLCTRVIVLDDRKIVFEGPMRELARDRRLLTSAGVAEPTLAPLISWLDRRQ